MKLIKLDATDSTNDYLKQLSSSFELENYTTVVTRSQTSGKGQMGAIWKSEDGKNLTCSILLKYYLDNPNKIFDLNVAVANAIIQTLEEYNIPELSIKWPNDILSGTTKIAGILIENSFKPNKIIESIIGIGLNVNQTNFENLPKASSLFMIKNQEYDLEELLEKMVMQLQHNYKFIEEKKSQLLWDFYLERLFKKNAEINFKTKNSIPFKGEIIGVSREGLLKVLVNENEIKTFSIKEIQMIY